MDITMENGLNSESEDMISCARNIITTVQGTMPYMRDMGIPDDIISRSSPQAADAYVVSATEQIEIWDERLCVSNIRMEMDTDGILQPKVVLTSGGD